ncbi:MAG: LysM peptidoglycan-binding domain-containing protein [Bacteroidales bacterium]|nr:LysM peptidoglycan-binding domain-containing protein [Bacteroidales bacterium]
MKHILLILTAVFAIAHTTVAQESDNLMACDTITDINFRLPDDYVANLEQHLDDWYIRNYTAYTPQSNSITHSANYPDSVYRNRLNELETIIPMPYNQVVRNCIDRYMRNHNNSLGAMLGRSVLYMPIFEQALEEAGLPLELKYLSVVESALRPSATSRVGAAGLWQFMPATGRMYNLHISTLVDERRDPYKSSVAAAQYLKDLYEMFGDWHLALAAYNCGPGRISRAINSTGKKDFWDIYYTLPSETRMYVPLFIAANYAMTYYQEHNIEPILPVKPLTTDTVMIQHKLYFEHIATVMNIPLDALKELNPQYRCDIIPGSNSKPYSLTLPSQQAFVYSLMQDSILAYAKKDFEKKGITEDDISIEPTPVYHKVRSGETLSTIARKYSTTVKNIKRWSNIKSDKLRIGQRLIVGWSNGEPKVKASSKKSSTTTGPKTSYHKVRKGETLSTIARKYGTTVQKLKKANNIQGDNIQVGQRLSIP